MAAPPTPPQTIAPAVDAAAAAAMRVQHLPGLVVLVATPGAAPVVRAYGLADLATKTPVTAATRFEIGSITKQFTAACILQLAEAHRLSLDDTLATYVPSYVAAKAVTIRQLLGQTTGIPEYLSTLTDLDEAGRPVSFDALLAHVSAKPLAFAPGTQWAYSNTNYVILGHIVELVSHEPYEHYVREHIFAPAGMHDAGFIGDGRERARTAHGYAFYDGKLQPGLPLDATWAGGAGAIVATAADLLAWDTALLAGTLITPADVTLMRTSGVLPSGEPTRYGFGWIIDGPPAHPRIWHNGGTFGFSSTNATYPADGTTIIALTNLAYSEPVLVTAAIFRDLNPGAVAAEPTPAPGEDPAITARVRDWLGRFQRGDIDRTQLAPQMDLLLTADVIAAAAAQIGAFGPVQRLIFTGSSNAAGQTLYTYTGVFADGTHLIRMSLDANGKISGYRVI